MLRSLHTSGNYCSRIEEEQLYLEGNIQHIYGDRGGWNSCDLHELLGYAWHKC